MSLFVTWEQAAAHLRGKSVAVVGSAPSVLENVRGVVDGHDVVVRVNNYKTGPGPGYRCDVHYAFYGTSVRNRVIDLERDGVKLCWCKCPNAKPIESEWHERNNKINGIDFRYIYRQRADWWFCPTYVPSAEEFQKVFNLLGRHIPTTGFSAILAMLDCAPRSVYITGFDFFASKIHNVDEPWRPGDPADPIGHRADLELDWLCKNAGVYPINLDKTLQRLVAEREELRT